MKKFNRLLSVLLVFCMVLAMIPAEVFAVESNPGTLSTDIGSKTFYVGEAAEFTFTTTANDDAGKMVLGSFEFSDSTAIAKLEYLESRNGNWYEFYGDFGPAGGFPMIDGTSTFRVTFKKAGSFAVTAAMKMADGSGVVCSTQATVTVSDHKPGELTTDLGSKSFKVGQTTEFTFTTKANDDANKMVLGSFVFSDSTAIDKLEYLESRNGNWYELKGDFGPAGGFPMIDGTSTFRVTFNRAGSFAVTAAMKMADGSGVVCSTQATVTVSDRKHGELHTDVGEQYFKVGQATEFTFTTKANDDLGVMVVGSAAFSAPDAIEKLEYYEDKDGKWYELKSDFGPIGGFPMSDATSRFRVTFKRAGEYRFTAVMKAVADGQELCSVTESFSVAAKVSAEMTSDIAQKEFVVGEPMEFTFSTKSNDDAGISVIGSADFSDPAAVEKLEYYEVTDGNWYELKGDFGPASGFPMSDATSKFRVTFSKPGNYTVNATMKDAKTGAVLCSTGEISFDVLAKYKVTVSTNDAEGGSVSPSNETVVVEGGSAVFTVTANEGYQIDTIGGATTVEMAEDKKSATVTVTPNSDTTVVVNFVKTYDVKVTYSGDGTIVSDPELMGGSVTVVTGSTVKVTATPDPGYRVAAIEIKSGSEIIKSETFDKNAYAHVETLTIDKDYEITVTFAKSTYQVTVTPVENGTVTIDDADGIIDHGGSTTMTVVPDSANGYEIKSVTVNGEIVAVDADGKFTISDTKEDKTIVATFVLKQYDVTIDAGENGTVTTNVSEVVHNEDVFVTITPNAGYSIGSVKINGVAITELNGDTDEKASYTISKATSAQHIVVTFVPTEAASETVETLVNYADVLRDTGVMYVFANNGKAVFATEKSGIRIYVEGQDAPLGGGNVQSVEITEDTVITKIELRYKADDALRSRWHEVPGVSDENPLKIVFDKAAAELTLKPAEANANGYYNSDVVVEIDVKDLGDYAGIASVKYWIVKDGDVENPTQSETLYNENTPAETWNGSVTVNAELNNSDNVELFVEVTDRAGNTTTEFVAFQINCTAPVLEAIEFVDEKRDEAEDGYYSKRVIKLTINDRGTTFDAEAAKNGVQIDCSNAMPLSVEYAPWAISCTSEGEIHTLTIEFVDDGRYEWSFAYQNKAGLDLVLSEELEIPEYTYQFTVDDTAPVGSIHYDTNAWSALLETLTFGIWSNNEMIVTAQGADATSPVKEIMYYKSNRTEAMKLNELEQEFADGSFTTVPYEITSNEKFAVYARIVDYAGNVTYIGTNGMVFDNTDGHINLVAVTPSNNGLYNQDVKVQIEVKENAGDHSGIKSIDYKVVNYENYENPVTTQSGNLYTFNVVDPTYNQLKASWMLNEYEGEDPYIIVDGENKYLNVVAQKNNSDNIKVIVTVVDNAGNVYEEELRLLINIDELSATIEVTGEPNKIVGDRGYYDVGNRVATITIENDRSSSFDQDAVKIDIAAKDGNGNDVSNAYIINDWESNGTTHTAKILFLADANYTWSISYTNKAGNILDVEKNLSTGESKTPYTFTIDDTDPTGSAAINDDVWEELLEVLTFGLFTNDSFTVVAKAEDQTSPVVIQYYKTDWTDAMTASELDAVSFQDYEAYEESCKQEKSLTIADDERFVVYQKITDYAGNYIYLNADGAIVDQTPANIELIPEKPNANGIYGKSYGDEIEVAVKVTDAAPYSGIKMIEYWIECDGVEAERENLYSFEKTAPFYNDLKNEWSGNISVPTELNSSNVVVFVKTVDNAGNESVESKKLDIDITAPQISVSYNDEDLDGARNEKYFDGNRTATIVITERTNHFDAAAATAGIIITAKDAEGKAVAIDRDAMISAWKTVEGKTADAATHTATISYNVDANYTFSISYSDKADNGNADVLADENEVPYEFTVDKVDPFGTVTATSAEGRVTAWNELVGKLTFGFWSGKKITVTGEFDDVTSPIESVEYYRTSNPKAMTQGELEAVNTWTNFADLVAVPNEQLTIYIKITDNAGHVTYISTNGMIVDDKAPIEEVIAPEITVTPEQPINGFYNKNVKVRIEVTDPIVKDTFAGLKTISYRVLNMGEETQSGILWNFGIENPVKDELFQNWNGYIVVDSERNNSDDVVIEVFAEDNAGNTSSDKVAIKIDITAPRIDVSYNNNKPDSGEYYNANRVATVTITERNLAVEDIVIKITRNGKEFTDYTFSGWETKQGTGNLDDTTHTANITYKDDGDYTFAIECKDRAGWANEAVNYGGSANPTKFTIDKTNPVIRVSYNNNEAENGKYFKAARTATITIVEHNFDGNRVIFTRNAARGGTNPNIAWAHNGDTHTATISYTTDGDYTFDVTMSDKAGNNSGAADYGNSVAAKDFVIDLTFEDMITIGGVENGKAYGYSDDVIPTIDISDINLESYTVSLAGVQKDTTIDLTEKVNELLNAGAEKVTGTFDIFEVVQDLDGIYTLKVTSLDKAGNSDEEEIIFTVNRFGSVYVYEQYLMDLISNGGTYVQSVTEDLVIMEYNADKLVSGSPVIEITCDGKPLENVIYEVTPEINDSVAVGESGWYQYKYTISKDNFSSDGVYKISVSSKDATGNTPENNRYEGLSIAFRVDSTLAEISSIVGLEEPIINATKQDVKYTVYDTMGIKSIKVYIDGSLDSEITDFSADLSNYTGSFTLKEKSSAQHVRIVVEDLAGNITDTDDTTFSSAYDFNKSVTVSTNIFVRWYANKLLFWGSIVGVLAAAAGLWYFLAAKRKKKEAAKA